MTWVLGETASESFYTGVTGETFTCAYSRIGGSDVTWNPTFAELGGGWYRWTYTPLTAAAHEWAGTGSVSLTPIAINESHVITAAQADPAAALASTVSAVTEIKAKTDIIGTGRQLIVTSPVSADAQTLTMTQGDDYTEAVSNPIPFTEPTSGPAWPTLTGATVRLILTNRVNATVIEQTGTVEVATGDGKQVQFELTAGQTGALSVGDPAYYFAVVATLAAGAGERTLVRGTVTVERDARP